MKNRTLKIQTQYRQRKYTKQMHVVPQITLKGNWLESAGFYPTTYVEVTIMEDGAILIKNVHSITP